jgi:hypothetical protein
MYSTRKCSRCQEEKSESSFSLKYKATGKLQSACKECHAKYHKKHYQENKAVYTRKRRVNNRKYRTKGREFIDEYKRSKGCNFCHENTPCCLDFHHIDPTQKTNNISKMKSNARAIHIIEKEINKCIVVCSNCHRKLHAGLITLELPCVS